MKQPDTRFIAYFDMLGIAGLTMRRPETAWGALSKLALEKARIRGLRLVDKASREEVSERLYDFTFSDTVIIMTRGNEDLYLTAILVTSLEFFMAALSGRHHGRSSLITPSTC